MRKGTSPAELFDVKQISAATGFRPWDDMKAFCTTLSKLMVVWSWGATGWCQMSPYVLRFRVSGKLHRGYVFVCVTHADLFHVVLTTKKNQVVKTITDLFVGDFVETLDAVIETAPATEVPCDTNQC